MNELLKDLETLTDKTLVLWIEVLQGDWDDQIPEDVREQVEKELDVPNFEDILMSAIEEVEEATRRTWMIAKRMGISSLKDRIEEINKELKNKELKK